MDRDSLSGAILDHALRKLGASMEMFEGSSVYLVVKDDEGDLWLPFEEACGEVQAAFEMSLHREGEDLKSQVTEEALNTLIKKLVNMRNTIALNEG